MAQRQSKQGQVLVLSLVAVSSLVRALLYIAAGAWIWGLGCALVAIGAAYGAYQANLAAQAIKAAWQASGLEAPESDAEFKKCPDCGKFTQGKNVCRNCGHDFDYPPTTAHGPAA